MKLYIINNALIMRFHIFTQDHLSSIVNTKEFLALEKAFYQIVPDAKSSYPNRYDLNYWSFPGYSVESAILITYPIVKRLFPNRKFRLCIGQYHTSIIDDQNTIYDFIIPSLNLPDDFLLLSQCEIIEEDQIGLWWFENVLQYRSDISSKLIEELNY